MSWRPSLGAWPEGDGVRFRVWAPDAREVRVRRADGESPLEKAADGYHTGRVAGLGPGARYGYVVDGRGPFPDPASRSQPEGVHGPSEVIDPAAFAWNDAGYPGVAADDLILYEIHVGTFTPEGTFAAAAGRLEAIRDLGATAIELMPVADFPGDRNWGYDGVDLFAPARCYGRPDDLRRLVDRAHRLGLAVILDVVYNHLGPDGNYLAAYSADYFSTHHRTPWGPALNFDGPRSAEVRAFFIENALHWVHEYHLDGFRLDATHHIHDEGPRHILAELTARVRGSVTSRPLHMIAEDPRNLAHMVKAEAEGGWGLDGVWSDDFHHELRRYLVGDCEGVFQDFRGSLDDLAATIGRGWLFCGRYSAFRGYVRGSDPAGLPPRRFVFCIQNHDRIGNRARGERLNHQVDPATYRAATALLLCAPATPLLFMGQEWAAGTPFLFFTDHEPGLGAKVREGRRREFRHYASFADPAQRALIPDCQDPATFLACKLDWSEPEREPHAATRRFYRRLLALRRDEPALRSNCCGAHVARAVDEAGIVLIREAPDGSALVLVVRLRGAGPIAVAQPPGARPVADIEVVLTSEDAPFVGESEPHPIAIVGAPLAVEFRRPGAVLFRTIAPGFEDSGPPPGGVEHAG